MASRSDIAALRKRLGADLPEKVYFSGLERALVFSTSDSKRGVIPGEHMATVSTCNLLEKLCLGKRKSNKEALSQLVYRYEHNIKLSLPSSILNFECLFSLLYLSFMDLWPDRSLPERIHRGGAIRSCYARTTFFGVLHQPADKYS